MTTTVFNTKIGEVKNKIRDVSGWMATTVLDTKVEKNEKKIPDVSSLGTTTFPNVQIGEVKNKMPDANGLVKKQYYKIKISDIQTNYFTTSYYNKFTGIIPCTKFKKLNLETNSDFNTFTRRQ